MYKKTFMILITVWLILCAAAAVNAQNDPDIAVPDDFRGVWVCGRAEIELIRKDSGYIGLIHWASSYAEHTAWQYELSYDPDNASLTDPGKGIKSTTVFSENGEESSYTEEYTNGSARFSLTPDGALIWEDLTEDAGNGMEFEKVEFTGIQPGQEDLIQDYFHVIGGYHPGTAGSSLAKAQAAFKVYDFAQAHRLWNADIPSLRSDMLAAWESMSDEERSAFDTNFIDILRLIDRCLDDWEVQKGLFADAGVDDSRMEALLKDPAAQVSWSVLAANTLTMGNSDN